MVRNLELDTVVITARWLKDQQHGQLKVPGYKYSMIPDRWKNIKVVTVVDFNFPDID